MSEPEAGGEPGDPRESSLTPERWRQAQEVFLAALERAPAERDSFLDDACGADSRLRQEVDSLLDADRDASGVLERAVAAEAELVSDEGEGSGRKIGPYRLLRTLGHGGMSVVYLAVRDDQEYRQQVAVKLIKRGMDSDEIARRFRQERQILANLEHPAIARLLDGGTTEDGSSYLVMEHIEGLPIDRYCDRHALTISQRSRLFGRVCSAVHFAHQNLVVHRDLKPSNILITEGGDPRLLDFGIAKLLDPELAPVTVVETVAPSRIMTPEYASPEQVRGDPVTTASDVYSLGVLLYELLSGQRPYRFDSRQPREIERVICEQQPIRPSTAAGRANGGHGAGRPGEGKANRPGGRAKLRRRLAGDLDTIVMKAMHKEPSRRYASVEQLVGDVERHLTGLPVLARPDTLRYRAAKFARRHRLGVGVAALIAATIVASALFTARQARLARLAQGRAEAALVQVAAEKENAEEVLAFVEGIFDVADPEVAQGRDVTARELLEHGAAEVASQLGEQPEARARLMGSMGRIHRNLGLYEDAVRLHQEAVDVWRRLGLGPETAAGVNELAHTLYLRGDMELAEPLFREALEIEGEIWGEGDEARIADSLDGLGAVLHGRGEAEEAEGYLRRGLEMRLRLYGEVHADVAFSLHNLGTLLLSRGELAEAEPLLRRALAVGIEVKGEEHSSLAATSSNLATLHFTRRDYPAAEMEYRRVLALRRKLYGEDHPAVARSMTNLATVLSELGKDDEALELHERALAMKSELLGNDHRSLAMSLLGLGKTLHALGRDEEAEQRVRHSVDLLRGQLPADHRGLAEPLIVLGRVMMARGEAEEAEPLLREAQGIYRRQLPAGAWRTAAAESALAGCLEALGRTEDARELLRRAYPMLKEALGDDSAETRAARELLPALGLRDLDR